ncbi:MAG: rhomboid family intramembrane serine protease [Chitinophagales bacterium]|nr:rhomboid family intramembrane serine protease [Chitinophagales bacterium]
MEGTGLVTLLLIVIIVWVSYKGLASHSYLEQYSFKVDEILIHKEYYRLFTSGFLHVSWTHLIFNIAALYSFSEGIEDYLGPLKFAAIYFGSLICGDLFSLFIHRNHGDYSSVGASGAISGVMFAAIALFPGMEISFFGVNAGIPAWVFGPLYVLISIYGIKSQTDNIGHDAHLAGGIAGLLIALAFSPVSFLINYLPIVLILIPAAIFLYLIITRPDFLLINNLYFKQTKFYNIDVQYNYKKRNREKELDDLLDKINKKGMEGLSAKEKERLKQLSEN